MGDKKTTKFALLAENIEWNIDSLQNQGEESRENKQNKGLS